MTFSPAVQQASTMIGRADSVRVGSLPLIISLALWPFIQLGLTYYASVATAAMLLTLLAFGRSISPAVPRAAIYIALIVPLMGLCLLAAPASSLDVLRVGREALIFSLLVCVLVAARQDNIAMNLNAVIVVLAVVAASELLMTILQSVAIPRRIFITFPREFFVQGAGTLPELIDLIYSRIRPSGTFSEPSYLGFISVSLALAISPHLRRSRVAVIAFSCAIAAGLMSQSLAFIFAAAVLIPFVLLSGKVVRATPGMITAVLGAAVLFAIISMPLIFSRFSVLDGSFDNSIQIRFISPLSAVKDYIAAFPVGAPFSSVVPTIVSIVGGSGDFTQVPIDNAMYNLIFSYGYIGALMFVMLIVAAPSNVVRIYIIMSANFNGSLLSPDKFAVVSMTILIFTAGIRMNRQRS